MKKVFLFIALVATIMVGAHYAAAQQPTEACLKWHECETKALQDFFNQGPEKTEQALCQGMFQVDRGPECDEAANVLAQLGMFRNELRKHVYFNVIVPKCGEHPEE